MEKIDDLIAKLDYYSHNLVRLYKSRYEQHEQPKALKKITTLELGILNLLEWSPDISLKEVGSILDVPNSTLTSAVNRLEKKDILHRIIHPEDRRTFKLELTDKGKEVIEHRILKKKKLFKMILLSLDDDEEREILVKLIDKIYINLSK